MTIDMTMATDPCAADSCCGGPSACVFTKAVVSRQVGCELARRQAVGERDLISCASAVAQMTCQTLAALLRERARFALRLPRSGAPMVHAKALQLQCGGVLALQQALQARETDVHRLVGLAHERWGSLLDAPWGEMVQGIAAWQPRQRRRQVP
jgi:hypothetical protein